MKQWIPAMGEPFENREKIPMDRVDAFALLQMSAQVPPFHPDLKSPPGETDIGIDPTSMVGIGSKRHLQGERARVTGKSLPSSSHRPIPSTS